MRATSVSLETWCNQTGNHHILDNYNRGNNELSASDISKSSGEYVQWKCGNDNHSPWRARVSSVTAKASGCPTCAGRRVEFGVNDLLTLFPNVCKDWDYAKNTDICIKSLTPGSQYSVWWKCSICGKEWRQPPIQKINTKGLDIAGCVNCRRLNKATYSESLEDWCRRVDRLDILEDYNRGKNDTPASEIGKGSQQRVRWKCLEAKHPVWVSPISNRTNLKKRRGCPTCGNKLLVPGVNDFGTLFPDIAKEWDYERNYPTTPADIFPGNNTAWYWWQCEHGHNFKAKVNNRTSPKNRTGCPYCSNHKVWPGFNDLETWCKQNNFDILVQEYSLENKHKMSEILHGHDGKVWWTCSVCGNHYQSNVYYRTKGIIGCSKCNKARRSSFPEQALFFYIQRLFPDARNSYREVFKNTMELDVYIPSLKTGIEYDGIAWHNSKKAQARERKKYQICQRNNIKLLRIREGNVEPVVSDTCDQGFSTSFSNRNYCELDKTIREVVASLTDRTIKVDCEKDLLQIMSAFIYKKVQHNLANEFPEIAKYWDYDKNETLTPDMVEPHCGRKVWWKCEFGHPSYQKTIDVRVRQKFGCPYCSGRVATPGETDILSLFPNICRDWDYNKNDNIDIRLVKAGSQQKVWWKCIYCGREWRQSVNRKISAERLDISGCTQCRRLRNNMKC